VGITAETVHGYLTPTAKCLFAEQFKRFMIGDRFFYTNTRNLINEFTQGISYIYLKLYHLINN